MCILNVNLPKQILQHLHYYCNIQSLSHATLSKAPNYQPYNNNSATLYLPKMNSCIIYDYVTMMEAMKEMRRSLSLFQYLSLFQDHYNDVTLRSTVKFSLLGPINPYFL